MAERVLATPLSGLEVRRAVLDHMGRRLEQDCFLNQDTAYDYFIADVTISLRCRDIGRIARVELSETISGATKEAIADENILLEQADSKFQVESSSPNETRVDTGQDVPVLTTQNGKPEIKGVRYSRKDLAKAK